jgi:hypothetical protein
MVSGRGASFVISKSLSEAKSFRASDRHRRHAGNAGWVNVGIDHDTASFTVNAIRRWWQAKGRHPRIPPHRSGAAADN